MTVPAFADKLDSRLPSELERAAANQLRQILAAQGPGNSVLRITEGASSKPSEITLTPGISRLLTELLRHIGNGDAVTLLPLSEMLTTQQAADILNVSRPFLISLLKKGEIAYDLVGRHRRIKAEALFAYRRARDENRRVALDELMALDSELI